MFEKTSQKLIAAVFVIFLSLPALASLVGVPARTINLRSLREFPDVGLSDWMRSSTYDEIGDYLLDHLRFRDVLVQLNGRIELYLFRESPNPEVLLGTDGWLYHRPSFESPCLSSYEPETIVATLRGLESKIVESNRRFLFTIGPDKPSIHPEHLGDLESDYACARAVGTELVTLVREGHAGGFLDLWDTFGTARANGSPRLFWPNDSHWNWRAATLVAERIVSALRPGLWEPEALRAGNRRHRGDLTRLMGVPSKVPTDYFRVDRERVEVDLVENPPGSPRTLQRFLARADRTDALIEGSVFMLHDSYLIASIPMLSQYFRESTFINWNQAEPLEALAIEMAQADIVIVEIAQRAAGFWLPRLEAPEFVARLDRSLETGEVEGGW